MSYSQFIDQIPSSWKLILPDLMKSEYMNNIYSKIIQEYKTKQILPKPQLIFEAFRHFEPFDTKVVIIWQDPYHTPWLANGLAFSTSLWKLPQSLINIYKEICDEYDVKFDDIKNNLTWDLTKRADQWVLLLNNCLTVEAHKPMSHKDIWRNDFTNAIISNLNSKSDNIVFLLRGAFAQTKQILIDENKHLVLKCAHPSPLSVNKWFFGCLHFKKTNEYLEDNNKSQIKRL